MDCPVCRETLDGPNVATCHVCGRDFHLQVRTNVEGKDCGSVWINEEWLYLEFACQGCLEAAAAGNPPVRSGARAGGRRRYRRRL